MSTMTDPKDALQGAIGPTGEFERLLTEKIEAARAFLRKAEDLQRTLRGEQTEHLDPNRYKGMKPEPAMKAFFNSKRARAMTRDELIEELVSGNVKAGAQDQGMEAKRGNVKRSIAAQLLKRTSEYRKVGDKIGPKEWPDERFTADERG